ncbi:unnamed protein product [Ixodes persulcatus]
MTQSKSVCQRSNLSQKTLWTLLSANRIVCNAVEDLKCVAPYWLLVALANCACEESTAFTKAILEYRFWCPFKKLVHLFVYRLLFLCVCAYSRFEVIVISLSCICSSCFSDGDLQSTVSPRLCV